MVSKSLRSTVSYGRFQKKDQSRMRQISWLRGTKDQHQLGWRYDKHFQRMMSDVSKGEVKSTRFLSPETCKFYKDNERLLDYFQPAPMFLSDYVQKHIDPQSPRSLGRNIEDILDIDSTPPLGDVAAFEKWFAVLMEQNEKFQKGEATISNFEFDLFKKKLHLMFASLPDSILERMKELPKESEIKEAFSAAEVAAYFTKVDRSLGEDVGRAFFYSPLINGVPFNVSYKSGVLHEAYVQLGDSKKIDIYSFVRGNVQLPRILVDPINITVKGTLCMESSDFVSLNLNRRNNGKKMWTDTRSAILSAILGASDPNIELDYKLKAVFYDIAPNKKIDEKITTQGQLLKFLSELGFPVLHWFNHKVSTRVSAIATAIDLSRINLETLGILIRINDRKEEALSANQMCLYKHTPQLFEGRIINIEYKVLSNGILVALILLDGGGSQDYNGLKKVLISDVNEFNKLKPEIGDFAVVSSFQNLLPRIIKIRRTDTTRSQVTFPGACPVCNAELTKFKSGDSLALCCSAHLSCKDNTFHNIERFVSMSGFNIPTLSRKVIQKMIGAGLLFSPLDIFHLEEKDFAILEEIPQELSKKILQDIVAAKNVPLANFIYANIPGISFVAAEKLSYQFGTLKRLEENIGDLEFLKEDYDEQTIEAIKKVLPLEGKPLFCKSVRECGIVILEPREEVVKLCYESDLFDYAVYETIIKKIVQSDENYTLNDFEYDLLVERARKMEEASPGWKDSIGVPQSHNKLPWTDMVQMSKTYSIEELKSWLNKHQDTEFIVEPKINGIAAILTYKNGKLVSAVTKGRTGFGSDITDTIKRCSKIPSSISKNFSGSIRGELFLSESDLEQLNKERGGIGYPYFVDALSALVSSLKTVGQKRSITGIVQFYPFDLKPSTTDGSDDDTADRKSLREFLDDKLDFKCNGYAVKISSIDELIKYVSNEEARRQDLPFDIDGIIIRPIHKGVVGTVDFHRCYAFKYNQEIQKSRIKDVHFSVSPKGFLMASVLVEPLRFSNNRVVTKAFLEDPSELKDLRKNSQVEIMYSGGVRPKLISVENAVEETNEKIEFPSACPNCKSKLAVDGGGRWKCKNPQCHSKKSIFLSPLLFYSQIMKFGRGHLRNKAVVLNLIRSGYVSKVSDFYNLLPEEVMKHTNLSRENASGFLAQVERSKVVTPIKFLWALKIPRLNFEDCEKIVRVMPNVKDILDAPLEELVDKLTDAGLTRRAISSLTNYLFVHNKDLRLLLDQHIKFIDGHEVRVDAGNTESIYLHNRAKLLDVYSALAARLNILMDEMEQDLSKLDQQESLEDQIKRKELYRLRALISNAGSVTKVVQKSEGRLKTTSLFKPNVPNN